MVKQFNTELRCEELNQSEKIQAKAELLQKMRRRDLIKDTKKNCLKRNIEFVNPRLNINEYLTQTSEDRLPQKHDQAAKEVHSYKVALENSQKVLRQLEDMKIKNERPADYLVEMYKSDKQMFKVRRYLTQKEEDIKEKMQGKDWESKTKRREKSAKKIEAKKNRKKDKVAAKKKANPVKPKMGKVNGKNKTKKFKQ